MQYQNIFLTIFKFYNQTNIAIFWIKTLLLTNQLVQAQLSSVVLNPKSLNEFKWAARCLFCRKETSTIIELLKKVRFGSIFKLILLHIEDISEFLIKLKPYRIRLVKTLIHFIKDIQENGAKFKLQCFYSLGLFEFCVFCLKFYPKLNYCAKMT